MTNDDTTTAAPGTTLVAMHPVTGEAVFRDAGDTDLLRVFDDAVDLVAKVNEFGQAVQAELIRRLDARNVRKDLVGDGDQRAELETNAPTVDEYPVDATRRALERLVAEGILDRSVIDRVIVTPTVKPPEPPPPRVDKREINKLKGHDNPRVAALLGQARDRKPQRRTLKVNRGGQR